MALLNRLAPRELTVADFGNFLYSPHLPTFQNSTIGDLRWLKSGNLPVVITLSPFLALTALGPEMGTFLGFSVFCSLDSVSFPCSFFPKIIPSTLEFYYFSLINSFIVCACTYGPWYMCGSHRGPLVGISFFLPRCGSRGFCSVCKAWQHPPLPTAPPHWPIYLFIYLVFLFILQHWRLNLRLHTKEACILSSNSSSPCSCILS